MLKKYLLFVFSVLLAIVLAGTALVIQAGFGSKLLLVIAAVLVMGIGAMSIPDDEKPVHKPKTTIDLCEMLTSKPKPTLIERFVRWMDGDV